MKDEELRWQKVTMEHVVEDQWIDLRRNIYHMPDGREIGPFYTLSRSSYAVIVAVDPDGQFLLVRQYRPGIDEVTNEFPAGGIEHSRRRKPSEEEALAAAQRELQEETGCVSEQWTHLLTVPSWASINDDYAYIYLAENCQRVSDQKLDDTEFLHVIRCSQDELEDLIHKGQFQQAVHVMAYYMALQIQQKKTSR